MTEMELLNTKIDRLLTIGALNRDAYLEVGNIVKSEIQQNFMEQGRPQKWIPSQRAKREGGQTLRDTGRLMNSFVVSASDTSAEVGTNVEYAAIHNFGGDIIRHAHSRLGVAFRRTKDGKQVFASKRHKKNVIRRNISVGTYTITIDPRPFDYISPDTLSALTMAVGRRLIVGSKNG